MIRHILIIGALGCRPDPGPAPDYAQIEGEVSNDDIPEGPDPYAAVSYTHLRAHET